MDNPHPIRLWLGVAEEAAIEMTKTVVPFSGVAIESFRRYRDEMQKAQFDAFKHAVIERLDRLEKDKSAVGPESDREFFVKVVGSVLDLRNADKVEFFANALVNFQVASDSLERLRFVDLLSSVSRAALFVLAAIARRSKSRRRQAPYEIQPSAIVSDTGLSGEVVDSCLKELFGLGIISDVSAFTRTGDPGDRYGDKFVSGSFTDRFAKFVSDPLENVGLG